MGSVWKSLKRTDIGDQTTAIALGNSLHKRECALTPPLGAHTPLPLAVSTVACVAFMKSPVKSHALVHSTRRSCNVTGYKTIELCVTCRQEVSGTRHTWIKQWDTSRMGPTDNLRVSIERCELCPADDRKTSFKRGCMLSSTSLALASATQASCRCPRPREAGHYAESRERNSDEALAPTAYTNTSRQPSL